MIAPSELIINEDGSVFHLHLRPEQVADKLIVCGDPSRVDMIASFFDSVECEVSSREFHTVTGSYKGKRVTALSHGIGSDNIDIVMTELDALKNVDFRTRETKPEHTSLEIVRVGTCGGLQADCPEGTALVSDISIGFDGVLNWYAGRDSVSDLDFERALTSFIGYPKHAADPYVVHADDDLISRFDGDGFLHGCTVSAVGFYGPQGREVRLPLASPLLNERMMQFEYQGRRITNYEMESAALAGMARLLGHKAVTVCLVIANRVTKRSNTGYKGGMRELVPHVLDRL